MPAEKNIMPPDTHHDERASGTVESRTRPRVKVHSLAYVELSEGNAGLILNISETGMAVQAVQMLSSNFLPRMQFRLPKTDTLIEAQGKLIWQIRSKKEAGIEFAGLSEQARAAVRSWIAAELTRQGLAEQLRPAERSKGDPSKTDSAKAVRDRSAQNERPAPVAPSAERQAEGTHAKPSRQTVTPAGLQGTDEKQAHVRPLDRPAPKEPVVLPTPPRMRGVPSHWRTQPGAVPNAQPGCARGYEPQAFPERIPAMPQWNGYMAPGVGMQFRKHRRWWTYTAAIGILAALGFAGLMVFNPDAITRARVDALIHTPKGSAANNQSAAGTEANPSTSQSANNNGGSANTQSLPTPQAPASNVPGQGLPPNSQASSAAVPPANNPAGTSARQSANPSNGTSAATNRTATNPSGDSSQARSSQYPSAPVGGGSATANGGEQYQTRSQQAANTASPQRQNHRVASNQGSQYGRSAQTPARQNAGRRYAYQNGNEANNSRYSAAPAANPPSNSSSPAPSNSGNQTYASNSQPQQPAKPEQSNESALRAWRAQTASPSNSGTAPNAGKTGNQATARQQAENAYKNSAPYKPASGANSPSTSNSSADIIVVGMTGGQSMAVPPSMPLSGVPSGSVAATSQVRAIRVPTSLTWARRYLPGNLGLGRLLSSYSPAYPIEAAREGIEGTVNLDVIVGTDGTVRSVSVLSGPAMLSSAAVSAVRDWRYGETFLAGEPIETEQRVSMVFRLTSGQ